MKRENIAPTLKKYYADAASKFGENHLVGIFLYGSQNYDLDTKESDVDAFAIIIPRASNVLLGSGKIGEVVSYSEGNLTYQDIGTFANRALKNAFNCLEILATGYSLVNPKYSEIWNCFASELDLLFKFNQKHFILSMLSMTNRVGKKVFRDEGIYEAKPLASIMWATNAIEQYLCGGDFRSVIKPKGKIREEILSAKLEKLSYEEALKVYHSRAQLEEKIYDMALKMKAEDCESTDYLSTSSRIMGYLDEMMKISY